MITMADVLMILGILVVSGWLSLVRGEGAIETIAARLIISFLLMFAIPMYPTFVVVVWFVILVGFLLSPVWNRIFGHQRFQTRFAIVTCTTAFATATGWISVRQA